MGLSESQFIFYERMLSLQYWASREIEHNVIKGKLREDFITNMVKECIPSCNLAKGIITDNNWQSTEADFLKIKPTAIYHSYGTSIKDSLIFMEIKSCAQRQEFNHLQDISKEMKRRNKELVTGMFCYTTKANERTLLKNFGFKFDNAILAYKSYNHTIDKFPDVDFCFCLNIDETDFFNPTPFFLHLDSDNERIMYRGMEGQSIANLFNQLRYEGV